MAQLPVDDLTLHGYEPPRITQFNVFLDNRVGRMLELMEMLHSQAIRVAAFTVIEAADYAINRLVVTRADIARRLLQRAQLPFSETPVLVTELPKNSSMVELCRALVRAEINILYAYPLCSHVHKQPAIVLHSDDSTACGRVLWRQGFVLLGEKDLVEAQE